MPSTRADEFLKLCLEATGREDGAPSCFAPEFVTGLVEVSTPPVHTLVELERREPQRLALIHFGVADDPLSHLTQLRERLQSWSVLVEAGASESEFAEAARNELGNERPQYEQAMPLWQSYAGLERYWEKKLENAPSS